MNINTTGNYGLTEPMVTIPLSQYTDMVTQIQLLTDQQEIHRLQQELEALEAKRMEAFHRMLKAEDKLKEAGIDA